MLSLVAAVVCTLALLLGIGRSRCGLTEGVIIFLVLLNLAFFFKLF